MERFTNGISEKGTVLCNYKNEDCNDSCMRGTCKWSKKALQRLAELEDKLEQGTLIELPCKVGDRVYEPNKRGFISTYRVTSIVYMTNSINCGWEIISGVCSNVNGFNAGAIGKKVFLTLAEAYEKLKEVTNE